MQRYHAVEFLNLPFYFLNAIWFGSDWLYVIPWYDASFYLRNAALIITSKIPRVGARFDRRLRAGVTSTADTVALQPFSIGASTAEVFNEVIKP